jgi:NADH:ubiquinone oxidoreductase subunit 2 (subunit N)
MLEQFFQNYIINLNSNKIFFNKSWLIFSSTISLFLISLFIILLGILFSKKAFHIKIFNIFLIYYLVIYFINVSLNFDYIFLDLNLAFNQNTTSFVNLFIFLSTLTIIIFFLGICNVFFLEENTKIEFSLLVWFIYLSSIFLIANTTFISTILLLECITFSSYVLVGFARKNKFSTASALTYLILGAIPSGIFILGLALLYYKFGSFSQDYLNLIFQGLLNQNDFDLINHNQSKNFCLIWQYINQTYFNQPNFLVKILSDKIFLEFLSYLNDLNFILSQYNGWIPFELVTYEYKLSTWIVYMLKIDRCMFDFERSPDFYIYCFLFKTYFLVIRELFFLKYFWELIFNNNFILFPNFFDSFWETGFLFSEPLTGILLNQNKLDNILNWFRICNFVEFWNQLTVISPKYFNLFYGAFCTPNAQVFLGFYLFEILPEQYIKNFEFPNVKVYFAPFMEIGCDMEVFTKTHKIFEIDTESKVSNYSNKLMQNFNDLDSHKKYLIDTFIDLSLVKISVLPNLEKQDLYFYLYHFKGLLYKQVFDFESIFTNTTQKSNFLLSSQSFFFKFDYLILINNFFNKIDITVYVIILFIIVNLCFKLTAAPFHTWAPTVYGGAPLATVIFLSIFSKLTIGFLCIWLFFNIFDFYFEIWQAILIPIALLSIIISILGAFSEKFFKRFLIYSSISHVGFILFGISMFNLRGIQASLDYLSIYIISSFILWFILLFLTKKTITIINLKGLFFNQPQLSLIFAFVIFSLSGIPPLAGFFVKYEIFYSILNSSFFYIGYILLLLTVISFFYYLRIIKIIFFEKNNFYLKKLDWNDIKLRVISICFFMIFLFFIFFENSFSNILYEILKHSLI